MPSMFSARLVGALRRFHGQRAATSAGSPAAVNQSSSGQRPWLCEDLADPLARDLLDRLAEQAARGATEPRAVQPVGQVARHLRATGRAPAPGRLDRGQVVRLVARGRRRATGSAASSSSSSVASARSVVVALLAPARRAARRPCRPPPAQRRRTSSTGLPSAALAASSWATRSCGCTQVSALMRRPSSRGPRHGAPRVSRRALGVLGEHLAGDVGHRVARRLQRRPAGLGDLVVPVVTDRSRARPSRRRSLRPCSRSSRRRGRS